MMEYGNWLKNCYGMEPMSLEEEINLPKSVKQTRNNKIKIIDRLALDMRNIESLIDDARRIPECDDAKHAALVQKLTDAIMEIDDAVYKAMMVGRE